MGPRAEAPPAHWEPSNCPGAAPGRGMLDPGGMADHLCLMAVKEYVSFGGAPCTATAPIGTRQVSWLCMAYIVG